MDKMKWLLICLLLYSCWDRTTNVQEVRDPASQNCGAHLNDLNDDQKNLIDNSLDETNLNDNNPPQKDQHLNNLEEKDFNDKDLEDLEDNPYVLDGLYDVGKKLNYVMTDLMHRLGGMLSRQLNKTLMVLIESVSEQDKPYLSEQHQSYNHQEDHTRPQTRFREERIDDGGPVKNYIMATLIRWIERWLQSMWRTMEVILTYTVIGITWTSVLVLYNAIRHKFKKNRKNKRRRNYYMRQRIDQNEFVACIGNPASGESLSPQAELHVPDKEKPAQWGTELKGSLETGCQDYKELEEILDDPDINVDEDHKNTDIPIYHDDNEEDDICVNDFNEGYADLRVALCEPEVVDDLDMEDDIDDCTEEYGLTEGNKKLRAPLCEPEVVDDLDIDDGIDDSTAEYGLSEGYTEMQAPLCEQELGNLDELDDCNCTEDDIEEQIAITMEEIEQLLLEHREGVDELKEGFKAFRAKQIALEQQEEEDSSVPQGPPCDMEGEKRGRKRFPKVRAAWKRCKKVFRRNRN